ncbi:MAG TPA: hypothetical protein VFZ05_04735 [Nitrososphaera sp.]
MERSVSAALAVLVSAVLLGSAVFLGPANRAYAHTFQGGESAEFLTTIQVIDVQASLAVENASDPEVAAEHIEHAAEELDEDTLDEIAERNERIATDLPASLEDLQAAIQAGDTDLDARLTTLTNLLGEAVSVRIESDQLSNSTVQAVVVSNLVNEALVHYGEAIGSEMNMTDMSSMNTTDSGMESGSMGGMEGSMEGPVEVVNEVDYQSSLAYAQRAQERYGEIKADAIEGTEDAVGKLDSAFPDFVAAIENKGTDMDVMRVAHLEIHPNLMVAYNLQIIPEFPLPLLLLIPAMAGAILYGRFSMKRI